MQSGKELKDQIIALEVSEIERLTKILIKDPNTIIGKIRSHLEIIEKIDSTDYTEDESTAEEDATAKGKTWADIVKESTDGQKEDKTDIPVNNDDIIEKNALKEIDLTDQAEADRTEIDHLQDEDLTEYLDGNTYRQQVKKVLVGAWLANKIYVSEKMLRCNDIKDGDWVEGKYEETRAISINVIKKNEFVNNNIILEENLTVQKIANVGLCVFIKLEDHLLPMNIKINEKDISILTLKEGDIVDYAYYKGREINGKIPWKYE